MPPFSSLPHAYLSVSPASPSSPRNSLVASQSSSSPHHGRMVAADSPLPSPAMAFPPCSSLLPSHSPASFGAAATPSSGDEALPARLPAEALRPPRASLVPALHAILGDPAATRRRGEEWQSPRAHRPSLGNSEATARPEATPAPCIPVAMEKKTTRREKNLRRAPRLSLSVRTRAGPLTVQVETYSPKYAFARRRRILPRPRAGMCFPYAKVYFRKCAFIHQKRIFLFFGPKYIFLSGKRILRKYTFCLNYQGPICRSIFIN